MQKKFSSIPPSRAWGEQRRMQPTDCHASSTTQADLGHMCYNHIRSLSELSGNH